jgi:hypothetical protein
MPIKITLKERREMTNLINIALTEVARNKTTITYLDII